MNSRNILGFILFLIMPGLVAAQDSSAESFIFHPENLAKEQHQLRDIYGCMGKYYQAVELANLDLLDEVFHASWFMRDDDTKNGELNVEDKNTFIIRVKDHGPYLGYAQARTFAQTSIVNDNLAMVRIDKATSGNTTCFFLYRENGSWLIMDKLWVTANENPSQESYAHLESLLPRYFRAIRDGDRHYLSQIMHAKWNLKHLGTQGGIQKIQLGELFEELPKIGAYPHSSPLTSISLFQDKLAIVRLDWPQVGLTTFLNFFKIKGQWLVVSERRSQLSSTP